MIGGDKSYALSGGDIENLLNGEVNVMSYDEIADCNDIEDVLGEHDKCVILYKTKQNYGHWTCLYRNGQGINYFDSYGEMVNDPLNYVPKWLHQELGQDHKHLIQLLLDSNEEVHYNNHKLQSDRAGVNTCGRWCCIRLMYPEITVDEFGKMFKRKKLKPDDIIVKLTN